MLLSVLCRCQVCGSAPQDDNTQQVQGENGVSDDPGIHDIYFDSVFHRAHFLPRVYLHQENVFR